MFKCTVIYLLQNVHYESICYSTYLAKTFWKKCGFIRLEGVG